MHLQKAIACVKDEAYFSATFEVRKAYKLLEENQKKYPDFKPNLEGLGLIHAAVGTIPKSFQWTAAMIGLSGTIKQGISELKQLLAATASEHESAYLKDETILLLTFTELNLGKEKDKEMMRKRFYGIKEVGEKPLILFSKSIFHFAVGENDSVISLLSGRSREGNAMMVSYLDFMEGTARLNTLDYTAEKMFSSYVNTFKGSNYIKAAWQHLAWIRLLQGDLAGYKNYVKKYISSSKGNDLADEDQVAIKEAESGIIPNTLLLRSRLLFDGGYYNRALLELAGKPLSEFPTQKDQLEFTYRLARIFDKTKKNDKAIQFYEQTIKNGEKYNYYFAANSALSLGQMYEDAGDKTKAVFYYKKTLSMRNHDYQNSIDQKAKAGLNRLND
jgi:tetratricopeptide (TPR) repeat protein